MTLLTRRTIVGAAALLPIIGPSTVLAATAAELDTQATNALSTLYATSEKAKELGAKSKAVLIFPKITKAGLIFGAEQGDGVLRASGKTTGYYRIFAGSLGLQAGIQTFGLAMFFITQSAINYLQSSKSWALGSGPSVVVANKGMAGSLTTTTLTQDVYAMPFDQQGLMADLSIAGSKISRIPQMTPLSASPMDLG